MTILPLAATFVGLDTNPVPKDFMRTWMTQVEAQFAVTGREVLASNRTYYVRTTGNNSNSGTSAGAAFLTIAKAVAVVGAIDAATFNVTIDVGAGAFAENVVLPNVIGSGTMVFAGAGAASTTVTSVALAPNAAWFLGGFAMSGGTYGIEARTGAACTVNSPVHFYSASVGHISARSVGSSINFSADYSIFGGAGYHYMADQPGVINVYGRTITLTGTPAFSGLFAYVAVGGKIIAGATTFTGAATGQRYYAAQQGGIFVNGAGGSLFPGSIAGSVDAPSGGLYV